MVDVALIGSLSENYPWAAFSPDGSKLYVFENNRGSDIREYTYPGLSEVGIVVNDVLGPMACDGSGVLYWTDSEVVGTDVSCVIYKDPSSPTEIMRWTQTSSLPIVSICWSPFDDSIYALVNMLVSPFTDEGLWRIDLDGATSNHVESSFSIDTAVNTPVPTLDGAIWWSNPAPTRVYRHDIAGGTTAQAIADFFDSIIPQPDHTVIGWSTIAGTSKGRRIDAAMTITDEPDVDVLTPGQRGVAYVPDLSMCTVERRLTSDVWQIGVLAVIRGLRVGPLRMKPASLHSYSIDFDTGATLILPGTIDPDDPALELLTLDSTTETGDTGGVDGSTYSYQAVALPAGTTVNGVAASLQFSPPIASGKVELVLRIIDVADSSVDYEHVGTATSGGTVNATGPGFAVTVDSLLAVYAVNESGDDITIDGGTLSFTWT